MPSIMQDIKSLHPLLFFFIFEPPYLALSQVTATHIRVYSRLAPSQWETSLQSNAVSHWLSANLESALHMKIRQVWISSMDVGSSNELQWLFITNKRLHHSYTLLRCVDPNPGPSHPCLSSWSHNRCCWSGSWSCSPDRFDLGSGFGRYGCGGHGGGGRRGGGDRTSRGGGRGGSCRLSGRRRRGGCRGLGGWSCPSWGCTWKEGRKAVQLWHIISLVQDWSISIVLTMHILPFCTEPLILVPWKLRKSRKTLKTLMPGFHIYNGSNNQFPSFCHLKHRLINK